MNCPNCNTWNPDDKTVCWRCQTDLPRPKPTKKKSQTGFPPWLWVVIVLLFAVTLLAQCYFMPLVAPGQ
jgi:ribosomal protein L40E